MKSGHPRRTVVNALFAAIAVAIFMSGQALAATWTDPSTIWSKPAGAEWPDPIGLVTLDNSTLVAAYYLHDTGTFLQRSTDNGLTWGAPIDVSRPKTGYTAVSGAGNSVDLATLTCNNSGCAIGYQRSTDGGLTFSEPINLSDFDATGAPVISRGPDGTVAVVWYSAPLAKIFVRVSRDGGLTFAPRVRLWTVSNYDGSYSVAVTNGVMYAVSGFTSGSIEVRKSTNGTSWHSALSLGRYDGPGLVGHVQVAAEGAQVYVGWYRASSGGHMPVYRRSTNSGTTWQSRQRLSKPVWDSTAPMMSIHNGVVRATFGLRTRPTFNLSTYYRESLDGVNWTPRELVTEDPQDSSYPFGIGYTDHPIVAYSYYANYVYHLQTRGRSE